jgi:hypothetical protein
MRFSRLRLTDCRAVVGSGNAAKRLSLQRYRAVVDGSATETGLPWRRLIRQERRHDNYETPMVRLSRKRAAVMAPAATCAAGRARLSPLEISCVAAGALLPAMLG